MNNVPLDVLIQETREISNFAHDIVEAIEGIQSRWVTANGTESVGDVEIEWHADGMIFASIDPITATLEETIAVNEAMREWISDRLPEKIYLVLKEFIHHQLGEHLSVSNAKGEVQ